MGAVLLTLTSCLVWVWSLVSSGKEESRGPSGSSCNMKGSPFHLAQRPPSPLLCLFMYVLAPGS